MEMHYLLFVDKFLVAALWTIPSLFSRWLRILGNNYLEMRRRLLAKWRAKQCLILYEIKFDA